MKQNIIEQLIIVIREKGYAGMSLSCISQATGLKKSSIYHFFPNGKAQIALEIIEFVDQMLSKAFEQMLAKNDPPLTKFNNALYLLSDFYQNGNSSCLLDVMTIANGDEKIQQALKTILYKLINIFKTILISCDLDQASAQSKATDIITRLQGALVLCRVTNETHFFGNLIKSLENTPIFTSLMAR